MSEAPVNTATDAVFAGEKEITASVVTYNSKGEIDVLMKSLEESTAFDRMTVYVVDNASSDGTAAYLRENYPWARVIENSENVGFGKGHNVVLKNLGSRYHFIINPDIRVDKTTIEDAVAYFEAHPDVVVLTPYFRNVDGTQQFLPRRNPRMKYMIGGMFENRFSFCRRLRDEYTRKNEVFTGPTEVELCSGAFMIVRTDALKKAGCFDSRYYMYFEDADLSRELRAFGKAVCVPDIRVTHKWHRDNRKLNGTFFMALRSMILYMIKWKQL